VLFFAAGGSSVFESAVGGVRHAAATFFIPSVTVEELQTAYNGDAQTNVSENINASASAVTTPSTSPKRVHILIVPGHEPTWGGTEFRGIAERDAVADIAESLAAILKTNPRYDVMVSRTKSEWNPILQNYFDTHRTDIEVFRDSQKTLMESLIAQGSIIRAVDEVYHNNALPEAAFHLYGTNKWASDNNIDIAIHLHINDYAGRRWNVVGKEKGFAIYVPEHQYSNAQASIVLGQAISARLNKYHATSTLPKEDVGVVEDQELVAIGRYNTADYASILIEYGYIYEPQFRDEKIRPLAIADYAYQTYLGLQDFLGQPIKQTYGSLSFPYEWRSVKNNEGPGIYALQAALRYLDFYPGNGNSLADCPITGTFGPCTKSALVAYQRSHGLDGTGLLGPKTEAFLAQDLDLSER
jgi:N-acetylmuramoyl-L-alanine amidase